MKKFILLILVQLVLMNISFSQISNSDFLKYEGIWRYVNGTDTFQIFLKKACPSYMKSGKCVIQGTHKYIKNGIYQQGRWRNDLTTSSDFIYTISCYFIGNNANELTGRIDDIQMKKAARLILDYNSNGTLTLWRMSIEDITIGGIDGPYKLPSGITLIKQ